MPSSCFDVSSLFWHHWLIPALVPGMTLTSLVRFSVPNFQPLVPHCLPWTSLKLGSIKTKVWPEMAMSPNILDETCCIDRESIDM